jgi:hypothetical protein
LKFSIDDNELDKKRQLWIREVGILKKVKALALKQLINEQTDF